MSKQIDERVVSMQFDNANFEKNANASIGTLEKLKQSLNLTGASKGLENVNAAAGKVNMSGLATGVQAVSAKFSALEVMGVTALANITNSAVNAGKRIVSALTIDPVMTGFSEYELKMDSVKTIVASTGEELSTVNKYLEELNEYSDQTIYSFSDMTQNIGKFTNAGVKLEDAVMAIKGISNEAAVSGANANEASRAMYNFAQALSSGYVKLIDWKSIENANMATVEFKQQLIDTAVALGTVTEAGDGMYQTLEGNAFNATQNFNEVFQDQWMTSEVLVETLKEYADETTEIGAKAKAAAQDVTKFSQIMDIAKETAQSGWAKTWELIFGDLNQAKALFTPLSNFINSIIDGMSDFRNAVLESALGRTFTSLLEPLKGLKDGINTISEPIKEVTKTLEDYNKVVNEVIRGEWGHTKKRWDALTEAGYDWITVQNMVNEKLGNSKRRQTDFVIGQSSVAKSTEESTEANNAYIASLTELSEAELKALGLSDVQIAALQQLKKEADKLGMSVEEFLENIDNIDGRWVAIEGFKNAGKALVGVFKAIGEAWHDIFWGDASNDDIIQSYAQSLYDLIAAFHKFTRSIQLTTEVTDENGETITVLNERGEQLKSVFKGVFALFDIIATLVGGPLKFAFKAIIQLLGKFDVDILEHAANLGDAIVALRNWIKENDLLGKAFEKIAPYFKKLVGWVKNLYSSFKNSGAMTEFVNGIKNVAASIKDWFAAMKGMSAQELAQHIFDGVGKAISTIKSVASTIFEAFRSYIADKAGQVPEDLMAGLVNGLWNKISYAGEVMIELGKMLINKIKEVLGIHSPSTVFYAIGGFIIAGLLGGLLGSQTDIFDAIQNIATKCVEFFQNIDWGAVLAVGISAGLIATLWRIGSALKVLAAPLEGLGDVFGSASKVLDTFKGTLKSFSLQIKAKALKELAIAIAILAGSVLVLSFIDPWDLAKGVAAIVVLAGVLVGLSFAMDKLSKASVQVGKDGAEISGVTSGLLAIGGAMLMLAVVGKIIAGMEWSEMGKAAVGIVALAGVIVGLVAATKLIGKDANQVGSILFKISLAIGVLVLVGKLIASMEWDEMGKAAVGIIVLAGVMVGLVAMTKLVGKDVEHVGSTLLKMALAIGVLVLVGKLIASMEWDEMLKAGVGIVVLGGVLTGLAAITKLAGGKLLGDIGDTLLKMALAIGVLVLSAKLIASMEWGEMGKAAVGIVALGVIIAGLVAATRLAPQGEMAKTAATLFAMAAAIGILATVAIILSFVSVEGLIKGITAVGFLSLFMAGMIAATSGAEKCVGNLVVITIAIAVMAGAVAALSMLDATKMAGATTALSVLMGMFAIILNQASSANGSLPVIIVMTLAVGLLGGMLYLLAGLPWQNTIAAAVALSLLVITMSFALTALAGVGSIAIQALAGVVALTAMAIPLLAFVGILALMQGVQNAIANALTLIVLTTALTLLLIPLTIIGSLVALAISGVVALTAMAIPLLAFVGILALMQGIQNAEANVALITQLLTVLTGVLVVLAIVGPMALIGVGALAALTTLMVAMGALAVGIGALMSLIPADTVEEWKAGLNNFIDFMVILAGGLGEALGAFLGGAMAGIMESLPGIGAALSQFMLNAMPFIVGLKLIDPSMGESIAILTAAILALTAANVIEGVTSFLTGGASFARLGTELSMFMVNAMPFILMSKMIDPSIMEGVKALAEAVLILTGTTLLDQLTSWLTGGSSLASFGKELAAFGPYMKQYADSVAGIDGATVEASANAAKALAEMAASLPNEGGVVGWFMGENDMSAFGTQLVAFGKAMKQYAVEVTGIDSEAINVSVEAGKALGEMASAIPNLGGVVGWFCGDNDLATFGTQLVSFGKSLKKYASNVSGLNAESIDISVTATKSLSQMAADIPNMGGVVGFFTGDNDLSTFGTQIVLFGKSLKQYATAVAGINTSNITSSVSAAKEIAKLQGSLDKTGGLLSIFSGDKGLDSFGKNLEKFGKSLKKYSESIKGINVGSLSGTTAEFKKLVNLLKGMNGAKFDGANSFAGSLEKLGKSGVDKYIKAFKDSESKVKKAGTTMITKLINGIESKESAVKKAAKSIAGKGADGAEEKKSSFESAGKDLGSGLVKGIKAKETAAYNAGYALGQKAVQGEKDGQKSNSPSKLTIQAGKWIGEGLIVGMEAMGRLVYNSGYDLGESATNSISSTIARIGELVNGDIDAQPTITPVLDLSDVSAGVGALNSMLDTNSSIGLMSNINSIGALANSRQNGNEDVVSAIDKLGKALSSLPSGDTYNVNGVTYDDGSNINNAVQTLVRATIMEGRV